MEFIFGRSHTGKTQYLLKKVQTVMQNHPGQNILFIVPEQSIFRMERDLIVQLKLDGLFNISVLSFDRLVHMLLNQQGGRSLETLDFIGKSMICRSVIEECQDRLNLFEKSVSKTGFEIKLAEFFSEIKRQNISLQAIKSAQALDIDQVTKLKLMDIEILYESYNDHISENKLDSQDLMNLAIQKSNQSDFIKNCHVFVDGFDLLTAQILQLLISISKNAKDISITFTMNKKGEKDQLVFEPEKNFYHMITNALSNENKKAKMTYLDYDETKDILSKEVRHMETNLFAYPCKRYDQPINDISLYTYNNKESEVKALCAKIITLVNNGHRFRDITVCTSDISDYEILITDYFIKNRIPHFLDVKRKITQTVLAEFVMSLLNFALYEDIDELLIHLKCGFIDMDFEKLCTLENHIDRFALKGYQLSYPLQNELEDFRKQVISPIFLFLDQLKECKSSKDYANTMLEYFKGLHLQDHINTYTKNLEQAGDIENARIYKHVFQNIVDIIKQCSLSFRTQEVSLVSFASAIGAGLEASVIAIIPPSTDAVLIGDLSKTIFPNVKSMFILGLNQGKIPSSPDISSILNEQEKLKLKNLGVDIGYRDSFYEERYKIYRVFSNPIQNLILSYNTQTDPPSVLIKRILNIFPLLKVKTIDEHQTVYSNLDDQTLFDDMCLGICDGIQNQSISPIWRDLYCYFESHETYQKRISDFTNRVLNTKKICEIKNAKQFYAKDNRMTTSISRVESFNRCPFKYFMDYGVRPHINQPFEETNLDMGSFLHECLHRFTTKIHKQNLRWAEIQDEAIQDICENIVDEVKKVHNNGIFIKTHQYDFMLERLTLEFIFAVKIVRDQLEETEVTVYASELKLKDKPYLTIVLDDKTTVALSCNIDRVDICRKNDQTLLRVVDYKSSAKTVEFKEIYYGVNIQLPIYLNKALKYFEEKGAKPKNAGAFYLDLSLIQLEDNDKEKLLKNKQMNGFIINDEPINTSMTKVQNNSFVAIKGGLKDSGGLKLTTKSIFTEDEFEGLFKTCENHIKQAMHAILQGDITPRPVKNIANTTCDYCEYDSICMFDAIKDDYRVLSSKQKKDIIDA